MTIHRIFPTLLLLIIGIASGPSSTARADEDHQTLVKIHNLLHQAWGVDADVPPSDDQRTDLLKQALDEIKSIPTGFFYSDLYIAQGYVENAISEIKKGDPDHRAVDDIRLADSKIRSID